jgi:hypothetical protein
MSKLLDLVAIPLGFIALKRITDSVKDVPKAEAEKIKPIDTAGLLDPSFLPTTLDIFPTDTKPRDTDFGPTKPLGHIIPPSIASFFDAEPFTPPTTGLTTIQETPDIPKGIVFQPFDVLGGLEFGGLEKAWATIGKK